MSAEEWRPVPSYEGIYEVSDQGRIRSLSRFITERTGTVRRHDERILRLQMNSNGYLVFDAHRDDHRRTLHVHQVVLLAFVGPPKQGQEVLHGNGNRRDPRLSNLRYGSHAENVADQVRHGTHKNTRKTHCPQGHALEGDNLVPSDLPSRRCRTCHKAHQAASYQARMLAKAVVR